MQFFVCLLTSLVFAVHVIVGCTCGHRTKWLGDLAAPQADYARDGRYGDPGGGDRRGGQQSPKSCPHAASNYLKAELKQVDASPGTMSLYAFQDLSATREPQAPTSSVVQPVCRLEISNAQLFVWHCALII